MSQSMGIVTPSVIHLQTIESILGARWKIVRISTPSGRVDLHIQHSSTDSVPKYVSVAELKAGETADDYFENEDLPDEFRDALVGSSFFLFIFNDFELVKDVTVEFLSHIGAEIGKTWIDNDYGEVIQASVFLRNISSNPQWDWRRH